jgi:rhomboid protease GluP
MVRISVRNEKPVVVYVLMAITILIYLLQEGSLFLTGTDIPSGLGVKSNEAILLGQWWRLITPMFLHGGILHIAFNMYALYSFGPMLERHYGRGQFLLLYLLSGFAGNVASFMSTVPYSLGSSTAIFGLLGAYGMFMYQNRQIFGDLARRALVNIATIAVINLIIGFSSTMIDNWGHIGGLVGGTLFAWICGPAYQAEGVFPDIRVVDRRDSGDAARASLAVGALFALLAAATSFLRLR